MLCVETALDIFIGGSKGGGAMGPPPKGLTKVRKIAQFAAFSIIKKKISQGACSHPANTGRNKKILMFLVGV